MIEWIKSHKVKTGFIVAAAFIIPLLAIQVAFFLKSPQGWITVATWEAGDMINYCISFFALIGTTFLGLIAVDQGKRANDMNEALQKNDEKRGRLERQPSVMLHDVDVRTEEFIFSTIKEKPYYCKNADATFDEVVFLGVTLRNTSNVYIEVKHVQLSSDYKQGNYDPFFCSGSHIMDRFNVIHIKQNEDKKLYFMMNKSGCGDFCGCNVTLKLDLVNTIGEIYRENIIFSIHSNDITQNNIFVMPEEYNFSWFDKEKKLYIPF